MTHLEIKDLITQVETLEAERATLQTAYDTKTQEMVDAKLALSAALEDVKNDFAKAVKAAPAARNYAELGTALDAEKAKREGDADQEVLNARR